MKILILILAFSPILFAKSKLPVVATKQSTENLKFLSFDGKFTYYQRRSGSLLFSSNYKVIEVVKGKIGSHYALISSKDRKKIAFTKNDNFHTYLSTRPVSEIYSMNYGGSKATLIGKGTTPKLHLNDEWLSFFDPYKKELTFNNLTNKSLSFSTQINNKINPYFIPEVIMISTSEILYTDLNLNGIAGIVKIDRKKKEKKYIYNLSTVDHKIELCLSDNNLYYASFPLNSSAKASWIKSFNLKDWSRFEQAQTVYESFKSDIGHLKCNIKDQNIFFVQDQTTESGKTAFEIVQYNVLDKKTKILSDLKYATDFINMDGSLLIPFQGNIYIGLGSNYDINDKLRDEEK
jgi:hypothetical protein